MNTTYPPNFAGVILAGGESKRMGTPKALKIWQGKPLLQHAIDKMTSIFPRVYIIESRRTFFHLRFFHPNVRWILDEKEFQGPLQAMVTATMEITEEKLFFCACDMPQIQGQVIHSICDALQKKTLAAIPVIHGVWQPLFAAYWRQRLLQAILANPIGDKGPTQILKKIEDQILLLPETLFRPQDPHLENWIQLNYPFDPIQPKALWLQYDVR